MTRKHFQAIAAALAATRPDIADHTTTSAIGDNTFTNRISYEAANAAWIATRDAIADSLIGTNDQYDRDRFVTATEAGR